MNIHEWCEENGEFGKQLSLEWTGVDENDTPVSNLTISKGSGKKIKWKCTKCNNIWVATPNSRTSNHTGCPVCNTGHSLRKPKHSLLDWCNKNGNLGKEIKDEYTGIRDNSKTYDIKDVSYQSNLRLKWICNKNSNHVWWTTIQKRTVLGSSCPFCTGQRVEVGINDLKSWCLSNNKEHLIGEWIGIDENKNEINMESVAKSTQKKVYWKYTTDNGEEHTWIASISDRTYNDSGCPLCNGRNNLKPGKNDLGTWCNNNEEFGKLLQEQWIGITEAGSLLDIHGISYGSRLSVGWKCDECNKIYFASPLKRIHSRNKICMDCRYKEQAQIIKNKALDNGNSLLDWCKKNYLDGRRLIEEFGGKLYNGDDISIDKISYGSEEKVLWKHYTESGDLHQWYARIHNRTFRRSMCPICNNKGTSLPEQILYNCFKQIFSKTISRGKFQGYEFDITIPELKTCIEYGSTYYHKGREGRDNEKLNLCKEHNVRLIVIMDDSNNEYSEIWEENYIVCRINNITAVKRVIQFLFDNINIDFNNVDFEKAVAEATKFMQR